MIIFNHDKNVTLPPFCVVRKMLFSFSRKMRKGLRRLIIQTPTNACKERLEANRIQRVLQPAGYGNAERMLTRFVDAEVQALQSQITSLNDVIDHEITQGVIEVVEAEESASAQVYPLYEFEPDAETVLNQLLPVYIQSRVFNALLQSSAAKHAATQKAMKSASDNADKLITDYTRLRNNARQAEITQQIAEIVGGADALASGK